MGEEEKIQKDELRKKIKEKREKARSYQKSFESCPECKSTKYSWETIQVSMAYGRSLLWSERTCKNCGTMRVSRGMLYSIPYPMRDSKFVELEKRPICPRCKNSELISIFQDGFICENYDWQWQALKWFKYADLSNIPFHEPACSCPRCDSINTKQEIKNNDGIREYVEYWEHYTCENCGFEWETEKKINYP